jgi:hypothetical protein
MERFCGEEMALDEVVGAEVAIPAVVEDVVVGDWSVVVVAEGSFAVEVLAV